MAKPPARTNVNVPIKIWIESDTDGERLSDNVATTAGNQLGRALNILDERGEWHGNLAHFDVQFKGDAANLPEDRKRELYAYVGDGLAKGTQVAQAHRGGGKRKSPKRKTDGRKTKTKVQTKTKTKAGAKLKPVAQWRELSTTGDELATAFQQAASDWLIDKDLSTFPTTYGILFRLQGEAAVQLWVVDDGKYVCRMPVTVMEWSGQTPKHTPRRDEPNPFKLSLDKEDDLQKWRSLAIESLSAARAKEQGKVGQVKVEKGETGGAQAEHLVEPEKTVDEHMKGWDVRVYYWLRGLGGPILYPFRTDKSPNMPIQSRIEVVALVDIVEVEAAEGDEEEEGGLNIPDLPDPATAGAGGQGDGGGADKGRGLGSDVTAPPGQDVGAGGRGVVIAPEYKQGASIFPVAPLDPNAKSSEMPCQPYKDEPSVELITSGGKEKMKELIARIAARLDMDPCIYPANFCIQATRMIRIRASQVQTRFTLDVTGDFSAELAVGTLEGGRFRFRGIDSVGVQYLQHLAGTIPKIRELMELVETHTYPVSTFQLHHWFMDVMEEATQACGFIWMSANQIMMQQLLNSSRYGIMQRKGNPEYERVFALVCKSQLADQVEMIMLRTSLEKFVSIVGDRKGAEAYAHVREYLTLQTAMERWSRGSVDARKVVLLWELGLDADLVTRMSDETNYVFHRGRSAETPVTDAGSIVESTDGRWVIRASDGQLYDKDELNAMISIRQQVLVSIDPLMNQLANRLVTAIRPLVEDPDKIPAFLDKLFTDMLTKNDEVSRKNKADFEYAFDHAQIHKVDRETPPTVELAHTQLGGWQLTGIHALAHVHVGAHFEHDAFYVASVTRLISQEYYWRSFAEDMIFIFGIAFTIICPPLGAALSFAANLALGLEKYGKAKEQETIYGALIKPEEVLNYAEIQIDLFIAKLQIALSFVELVPYAGKGAKALTGLGKRAAQEGAKRGLRKLAKDVVMEELERIAKVSAENFVKALAYELVEETIEDRIVDLLVTPIIMDQIRGLEKELHDEGLL